MSCRAPLDLAHRENEISTVVANPMDVEWAAIKTMTVSLSAAVMTKKIKGLTTEAPEFGQIIRLRARRGQQNRSKQSSNGSMLSRALGLWPWSEAPTHSCTSVSWRQQDIAACLRVP